MLRILLVILIVMSSFVFAQTGEKTQERKIAEIEQSVPEQIEATTDMLFQELDRIPTAQIYIINYGTKDDVERREKQIRETITFRKYNISKATIINGGYRNIIKSEFWIVPANAEPPKIEPMPKLIDEFGKATNGNVKMRMDAFFVEINNNPTESAYIINYGTPREIAKRERQIRDSIRFRRYDSTRITFVNGGNRGNGEIIKTLLFLVPAGAEPPKP